MQRILLPRREIPTTQLGFGCAYLSPENAGVLDAAYEAGIRHFDVARAYGRGLTEGLLGKFLRRHSADITVTSKYGITPPFSNPLHSAARRMLRPLVKRLRRAPTVNARIEQLPVSRNRKGSFTGAEAEAALSLSLRNLRTERIDLYLMHVPDPQDLADPTLLGVLSEAVERGQIGAFGIGGHRRYLPRYLAERPEYCTVLQYEWTPLDPLPTHPGSLPIIFRAFGAQAMTVRDALHADPKLLRQWSDCIDQDLSVPGRFEQLMLHAALQLRPEGIVLFSSTKAPRVLDNVRVATDSTLNAAALRLVELARQRLASNTAIPA